MVETVVHEGLRLAYPDGFEVLSKEELKELYHDDNQDRWGIWDKGRHLIFAVFWHDSNALLGRLVGTKHLTKRAEWLMSKAFKANAYRREGFFSTRIGGAEAEGFSYTYQVQGIDQVAQTIICRQGACCYTLYWYARKNGGSSDTQVLNELLASVSFV